MARRPTATPSGPSARTAAAGEAPRAPTEAQGYDDDPAAGPEAELGDADDDELSGPRQGEAIPESRLNKSQKFVKLLEALQASGGARASELMARFDLDDRTLRRYLADLRELDLPLYTEGRGDSRRIWIDASYRRHGVRISLLELISLRFGRQAFSFLEGTTFASDMDGALETLSTFQHKGVDRVRHLDRKLVALPEHRKDHARDNDVLEEVLNAVVNEQVATAHYARVNGPTKEYKLHPLSLVVYKQSLYLFAYDQDAEQIKTFALDRFRHFTVNKREHFEYPEDYDPAKHYEHAFGIMNGEPVEVCLRFHRRAAPYIRERIWHHSQELHPQRDGGVRLTMQVALQHELLQWVLSFGPDVRVEAPPELTDKIRRLHREAAEGIDLLEAREARGER